MTFVQKKTRKNVDKIDTWQQNKKFFSENKILANSK